MPRIRYVLVIAGLLSMAVPGRSSILYNDGVPLLGGGGHAITGYECAEDFVLSTSATIEGAQIYVLGNFRTNTLTWTIYGDSGSYPGAAIATGTNPLWTASVYGVFDTFVTYYQFDFDLPSVALPPGEYWLGLSFSGSDPAEAEWVESTTPNAELQAARPIGGSWGLGEEALAFEITGTAFVTPEPATWTFMLFGFFLMFAPWFRQKRRR